MAVKYFCDACGKEIKPPSPTNLAPLGTLSIINPTTGKSVEQMFCGDDTAKVKDWIKDQQKKNGVMPINKDFNLTIAKK